MPKTTNSGSAKKSELPSTLKKSDAKAQRTFAKPTTRRPRNTATPSARTGWPTAR